MSSKPTSRCDRKQMQDTGWMEHLCLKKCTWYMCDTVITIGIPLFTNWFLEGRLGFILLSSIKLAALSSAGLMLWRHSATKLAMSKENQTRNQSNFFVLRTCHEWQHPHHVPVQGRAQEPPAHKPSKGSWPLIPPVAINSIWCIYQFHPITWASLYM